MTGQSQGRAIKNLSRQVVVRGRQNVFGEFCFTAFGLSVLMLPSRRRILTTHSFFTVVESSVRQARAGPALAREWGDSVPFAASRSGLSAGVVQPALPRSPTRRELQLVNRRSVGRRDAGPARARRGGFPFHHSAVRWFLRARRPTSGGGASNHLYSQGNKKSSRRPARRGSSTPHDGESLVRVRLRAPDDLSGHAVLIFFVPREGSVARSLAVPCSLEGRRRGGPIIKL